jgi:hypothetical protein
MLSSVDFIEKGLAAEEPGMKTIKESLEEPAKKPSLELPETMYGPDDSRKSFLEEPVEEHVIKATKKKPAKKKVLD